MNVAAYNPAGIALEVRGQEPPIDPIPPPVGGATPVPPSVPAKPANQAAADADYQARANGPGVLRSFKPWTLGLNNQHGDIFYQYGNGANGGAYTLPSLDPNVYASGTSSLHCMVPSQSGQNAGGFWVGHFSPSATGFPNFDTMFGDNVVGTDFNTVNEFWIQFRIRYSASCFDTVFVNQSGTGTAIKLCWLTCCDTPPCTLYPTGHVWAYCEKTEIIIDRLGNRPHAFVYNACGDYRALQEPATKYGFPLGYGFNVQNAMPAPYCINPSGPGGTLKTDPLPGCWLMVPDEWLTVKAHVVLGPRDRVNQRFLNSSIEMWMARQGQLSQKVLDYNPTCQTYIPLRDGTLQDPQWYGKFVFGPYMTKKDITQVHAPLHIWYDEPIVSTQDIADPGV